MLRGCLPRSGTMRDGDDILPTDPVRDHAAALTRRAEDIPDLSLSRGNTLSLRSDRVGSQDELLPGLLPAVRHDPLANVTHAAKGDT